MTEPLPAPPISQDADLSGFDFMPLFGDRLRASDTNGRATDAEFRAAINLWWAAWKQIPAASLPDDDVVLCKLADLGRDLKAWRKVRAVAMANFVKCSDGRFYHPFLAIEAAKAWESRKKARAKAKAGNEKRWGGRSKDPTAPVGNPVDDHAPGNPSATGNGSPEDRTGTENGSPEESPGDRKGQGQDRSSNNRFPGRDSIGPQADPKAGSADQPPEPPPPSHGERILAECRRAKMPEPLEADPVVTRWIAEGFTPSNVANGIGEAARSWRSADPMPPAYADAAVRRTADAERKARAQAEARVERTQAELEALRKAGHAPMPDEVRAKIPRRPKGEEAIP